MKTLLEKLRARFEWLEREDLRVHMVYLNAREVAELEKPEHVQVFDKQGTRELRAQGQRGFLWGAVVLESDHVPENHVCLVQDGLEGLLVDKSACVTLG